MLDVKSSTYVPPSATTSLEPPLDPNSRLASSSWLSAISNIASKALEYVGSLFGRQNSPALSSSSSRCYSSALSNSTACPLSTSRDSERDRFVMPVSQDDDDNYDNICSHSQIENNAQALIPGASVYVFTVPELFQTEKSLYPEIPYARVINWFLSRKNVDGIKRETQCLLEQELTMIQEETQKAIAETDQEHLKKGIKLQSVIRQKLALEKALGAQLLKDVLRPGKIGAKTYTLFGKSFELTETLAKELSGMDEDEKISALCNAMFGSTFTAQKPDVLKAVMCLISQNSGITAHSIVFMNEKQKNPKLGCVLVDPDSIRETYSLNEESDGSITYTFDYQSGAYRFLFPEDDANPFQDKKVHVMFSINLKPDEEPKLYYSYKVDPV